VKIEKLRKINNVKTYIRTLGKVIEIILAMIERETKKK
jgi:hypothetical protein